MNIIEDILKFSVIIFRCYGDFKIHYELPHAFHLKIWRLNSLPLKAGPPWSHHYIKVKCRDCLAFSRIASAVHIRHVANKDLKLWKLHLPSKYQTPGVPLGSDPKTKGDNKWSFLFQATEFGAICYKAKDII